MKKSLLLVLVSLCVCCFSHANAQTDDRNSPPRVLLIVREEIKPGMMPAHNRHSAGYAGIFGKLKTPNHRIAMIPVAGSENEVLYVTPSESFADIEMITKETDKKMASVNVTMGAEIARLDKEAPDLHSGMRDMLAVFRPELSFKPGVDIAQMRYFSITTVRVRPGQDDNYSEYVTTLLNVAREKAKAETHIAAFQVIAGMPGTTYMFFRPMKSLAEYDLRIGPRVREAMTDDQKKKADKMAGESVIVSETSIYAINPSMSYLPKEFTARDSAFWNPAPEVVAKPKPKKRVVKPATSGATQ
ncbi:MAG: hypothetical protein H0T64_09485 [Pyrinomonadaceae bacterium]|nr:hypothetical protein [Pyrinomonadaceae bacterium]MBA3568353.1 hypothetical protein [Pyrinomonadaceae bacterium]